MSGLAAKLSNYPSKPCPPTIIEYCMSVNLHNPFKTDAIYRANSLVGRRINPLIPTTVLWVYNLFIIGIKKAAVLPDPVFEHATMSRPAKIYGIAYFLYKILIILFFKLE